MKIAAPGLREEERKRARERGRKRARVSADVIITTLLTNTCCPTVIKTLLFLHVRRKISILLLHYIAISATESYYDSGRVQTHGTNDTSLMLDQNIRNGRQ